MSYYEDVYKKRVGFRGDTKAEIINAQAEQEFLLNLSESPNASKIKVNGTSTTAIVVSDKLSKANLNMTVYTTKDFPIEPGDIVDWKTTEWFIIATNNFDSPAYVKSKIMQTNIRLKFFNEFGALVNTPGIFIGPMSTLLREALARNSDMAIELDEFRAMLILPGIVVPNNSRIMLDGRVFSVLEHDRLSNKNLVYLSLQEDSFDAARDDLENGIADAFIGKKWTLELPFDFIEVAVGEDFLLSPTISQDGHVVDAPVTITSNSTAFTVSGKTITGSIEGEGHITVSLDSNPDISRTIRVVVSAVPTPSVSYLLVGADAIRWGEQQRYTLNRMDDTGMAPVPATFSLANLDESTPILGKGKMLNSITYGVTANEDGKIGSVKVTAVHDGNTFAKTVSIRSLW